MTSIEVESLKFFHAGERFLNGQPIDWSPINATTMFWLDQLRYRVESEITLIRGAHPTRPDRHPCRIRRHIQPSEVPLKKRERDENRLSAQTLRKQPARATAPNSRTKSAEQIISLVAIGKILTPFCRVDSLDCQAAPFVLWNASIS